MPINNLPKLLDPSQHVTDAQHRQRLEICSPCIRKGSRLGRDYCKVCLCDLELKTKLKVERCPLLKWDSEK